MQLPPDGLHVRTGFDDDASSDADSLAQQALMMAGAEIFVQEVILTWARVVAHNSHIRVASQVLLARVMKYVLTTPVMHRLLATVRNGLGEDTQTPDAVLVERLRPLVVKHLRRVTYAQQQQNVARLRNPRSAPTERHLIRYYGSSLLNDYFEPVREAGRDEGQDEGDEGEDEGDEGEDEREGASDATQATTSPQPSTEDPERLQARGTDEPVAGPERPEDVLTCACDMCQGIQLCTGPQEPVDPTDRFGAMCVAAVNRSCLSKTPQG